MSPALDTQNYPEEIDIKAKGTDTLQPSLLREPLKSSGSLKEYENFNATPIIGTEFPYVQLTEILKDETKIRDLAILGESIVLYPIERKFTGMKQTLTPRSLPTRSRFLP